MFCLDLFVSFIWFYTDYYYAKFQVNFNLMKIVE